MQTLSFGFKLPDTGDKGSVFFPALESNIQQLNDHNHNGINSAKLDSKAIAAVRQSLSGGSWTSLGDGNYRMLVTLPAGMLFDDCVVSFKGTDGGVIHLSTEKVSSTTYYLYGNDSTLALTAVYTS